MRNVSRSTCGKCCEDSACTHIVFVVVRSPYRPCSATSVISLSLLPWQSRRKTQTNELEINGRDEILIGSFPRQNVRHSVPVSRDSRNGGLGTKRKFPGEDSTPQGILTSDKMCRWECHALIAATLTRRVESPLFAHDV